MPLSLYLQACGSAAAQDAVSALDPDTDKAMGELLSYWTRTDRAHDQESAHKRHFLLESSGLAFETFLWGKYSFVA